MIQQFTAWRASDGTAHDTAYAAWKRELFLWLRNHGVDNDAIANLIVKRVDDGQPETLEHLYRIAENLRDTAPPPLPRAVIPDGDAPAAQAEEIEALTDA